MRGVQAHHTGLVFSFADADAETLAFIDQLVDACSEDPTGTDMDRVNLVSTDLKAKSDQSVTLSWSGAYKLFDAARLERDAQAEATDERLSAHETEFGLPEINPKLVPFLEPPENCSITDPAFEIRFQSWRLNGSDVHITMVTPGTPVIAVTGRGEMLLSSACWELILRIRGMRQRPDAARTLDQNWREWGRVRNAAVAAGAPMDTYLVDTRVILPEHLQLNIRETGEGDQREFVIEPTFDDAPPTWIEQFDRRPVQATYRIPHEESHYEVILDPAVELALGTLKKIPNRRVTGPDAHRLVTNPYAYLGPEVAGVLDEQHVEQEVARFRRTACRFEALIVDGAPPVVNVIVEPITDDVTDNPTISEALSSPAMIETFCDVVEDAMRTGLDTCTWRGHDLAIDGYSGRTVDEFRRAREAWVLFLEQPQLDEVAADEVHETADVIETTGVVAADDLLAQLDLARYYERIEGVGIETPYAIARIPRPKEVGSWLPDDIVLTIKPYAESESESELSLAQLAELEDATATAELDGSDEVELGDGRSFPTAEASSLLDALPAEMLDAARTATGREPLGKHARRNKLSLLIKPNIDSEDFVKQRAVAFALPSDATASIPSTLNADYPLKEHQEHGVAWLQHLRRYGSERCHGALLADDMGVGKTLQLLTVIIDELTTNPEAKPALVVAPVTLLENWEAEIRRFFVDPPRVRLLFGDALRTARAMPGEVSPELRATGQTMLRSDWLGDAQIVLTTYDAVRDYQFTLAEQDWSFVVCDEAQNIKNPNALRSRAVKKLKADFRIAATGTPVENSLQDIWSIFDFIQPGLLPPLNHFNRRFRRPIESKTEGELAALDELRDLLHPQILRRTKQEVVKELPDKLIDSKCLSIPMSDVQARLYENEIARVKSGEYSTTQEYAIEVLNALRYFRHLCVAPTARGEKADAFRPLDEYRRISPKFDWLISQLDEIRTRNEKVIIFVEMRDVQRQLRQYLESRYDLEIYMINGETATTIGSSNSRQRLIDRYQAKPGFNIIILSPLAAGVGLNIQAANHVIHYVRHWNPAREDQATDRAYRIGQTRDVHVYTPTVVGPGWSSFEETLDRLLSSKRAMAADMLNGCDDVQDDLRREFALGA